MRRITIFIIVILALVLPISALEITAPEVPESASDVMPDDPETFSEGLWQLTKAVIAKVQPELTEAAGVCLSVVAATLLISLLQPVAGRGKKTAELVCTLCIAVILLRPTQSLIMLGVNTVQELTEYSKLLLPVMTAALAAQGGVTTSTALYTGTAVFNTVVGAVISALMIPMIYIFLALAAANSAVGEDTLKKLKDFIKWCATWVLKIGLYIFTGYMGLTGVISGTTDAAALKATKMTISGVVPVIGNILSEASEAVLIGAGVVKNAAGVYGMLAILAVCLKPFALIGVQYVLLKLTAAICGVFATKQATELINDFSAAMGLLLAITGTICLMLLISTVCFMKGVG